MVTGVVPDIEKNCSWQAAEEQRGAGWARARADWIWTGAEARKSDHSTEQVWQVEDVGSKVTLRQHQEERPTEATVRRVTS